MDNGFDPDRILIIAAHPDDIEFLMAGSVAVWTQAGIAVAYCIATSGEKGFSENLPFEERIRIREEEQRAAGRVLGVERITFLRMPDGELKNHGELRRGIVADIRDFKPDVVVTTDPASVNFDNFYGSHPDHRALAEAAFDSIYPAAGNPFYFPELMESNLQPHTIQEALFGVPATPDYYVDISETFDIKMKALRCHESQVSWVDDLEKRMREWGNQIGEPEKIPIAEAYRRLIHPEARHA